MGIYNEEFLFRFFKNYFQKHAITKVDTYFLFLRSVQNVSKVRRRRPGNRNNRRPRLSSTRVATCGLEREVLVQITRVLLDRRPKINEKRINYEHCSKTRLHGGRWRIRRAVT